MALGRTMQIPYPPHASSTRSHQGVKPLKATRVERPAPKRSRALAVHLLGLLVVLCVWRASMMMVSLWVGSHGVGRTVGRGGSGSSSLVTVALAVVVVFTLVTCVVYIVAGPRIQKARESDASGQSSQQKEMNNDDETTSTTLSHCTNAGPWKDSTGEAVVADTGSAVGVTEAVKPHLGKSPHNLLIRLISRTKIKKSKARGHDPIPPSLSNPSILDTGQMRKDDAAPKHGSEPMLKNVAEDIITPDPSPVSHRRVEGVQVANGLHDAPRGGYHEQPRQNLRLQSL